MKLSELAAELGLKESYLKSHWALVCKRYEGYGIKLIKRGRGRVADFGIIEWNSNEIRWEHIEGRTIF